MVIKVPDSVGTAVNGAAGWKRVGVKQVTESQFNVIGVTINGVGQRNDPTKGRNLCGGVTKGPGSVAGHLVVDNAVIVDKFTAGRVSVRGTGGLSRGSSLSLPNRQRSNTTIVDDGWCGPG